MVGDPYASKFWKKSFDSHVKDHLDYPENKTYTDLFLGSVKESPDIKAISYMGNSLSFGELDNLSNRFANFLLKQGLKPGDVVGIYSLNLPAYYITIPAIAKAGCVLSGVSPLLTPRELEYQLMDSGAKALVALDFFWGNVSQVVEKTKLKTIVLTGFNDFLPNAQPLNLPAAPAVSIRRFSDILKDMPDDPVNVKISDQSPFLMQYTGGTTGPSKGAVLTHRNIARSITQWSNFSDVKKRQERMLSPFPLFHQGGLFLCLWSMAIATLQVAVPNPRDYDNIIKLIKDHDPSILTGVPTIYLELMKKPEFRQLDFSKVIMCISGAAPFPVEYIKDLEKIVGADKLVEVYGLTETCPVITASPRYGKHKAGSVGLPVCDTDIRIIAPGTKDTVPINEPGELAVKGPQVMKGYHNKPVETANMLRDGWLYTGDICKMDEDGYIFVVDRLKDMVNVSGFKVFTRELDEIICEHPDVDIAASVGLPDPARPGVEIVATAIVLKTGVEKSEAEREKILDFIRKKEASYKVPKIIEFMDQLPMGSVGKVLKRELREMLKTKI